MKRTKSIDLNRMRKTANAPKALAAAIGVVALTGCEEPIEAKMFTTLNDCIADPANTTEACEIAYKRAVADAEKTAPKYKSLAECQAEFGPEMCRGGKSDSGSDFFMPFMAGYMMSSVLDDIGDSGRRYTTTPVFTSSRPNSRYYQTYSTSTGSQVARVGQKNVTVSKSVYQAKPKATVASTKSRGGFGAKAAAKSTGGSRATSSRGGWGG